ncbi:hypothetical protein BTHERMOSOX_828 [Bathymodiolus thermophilus thioautotrophic gill symbiont]|nr:hypothetical protein BTHERMOSOX_828 [Bathymodiolus thermophilus thioautotrophic gill symbiont]
MNASSCCNNFSDNEDIDLPIKYNETFKNLLNYFGQLGCVYGF